jgi:cobalt-zinc-cadmium resistance protein CzcA
MLQHIVQWSLRNRFLVLVLTAVVVALGVSAARTLPIDAVPDISNVQVQILTKAPALGPLEVERFVTTPVERSMSGLPQVTDRPLRVEVRALAGHDGLRGRRDIYRARQLVAERLQEARDVIPEGYGRARARAASPLGLGEIYQFEVRGPGRTPMELRAILEGYISPQLRRACPGSWRSTRSAASFKTYQLELDPALLSRTASRSAMCSRRSSTLERERRRRVPRAPSRAGARAGRRPDRDARRPGRHGDRQRRRRHPRLPRQLGRVSFAPAVRHGVVTRDGNGEIVAGVVMMMLGENSRAVVDRVRTRVAQIQPTLPEGVTIVPFYDRTELIRSTISTVARNLAEGGILVIVVLFLFLRNLRAGLVVASLIPLSMLVAFLGMRATGLSGNLMSLGAIDFGLVVDGASHHRRERRTANE